MTNDFFFSLRSVKEQESGTNWIDLAMSWHRNNRPLFNDYSFYEFGRKFDKGGLCGNPEKSILFFLLFNEYK